MKPAEAIAKFKAGELDRDGLVKALVEFKYGEEPTTSRPTSEDDFARWYQEVELQPVGGDDTWSSIQAMAFSGELDRDVFLEALEQRTAAPAKAPPAETATTESPAEEDQKP